MEVATLVTRVAVEHTFRTIELEINTLLEDKCSARLNLRGKQLEGLNNSLHSAIDVEVVGINSSDDGFCLVLSGDNTLAWYRTNGTYLGIGRLEGLERSAQSICNIDDTYYIVSSNNSGGFLYRATIEFSGS